MSQGPYSKTEQVIVFLIDDWSSSKGGIQTVNRELCEASAQLSESTESSVRIICLAQRMPTDEHEPVLRSHNALVLKSENPTWASPRTYADSRILEFMWHPSLEEMRVSHVIGHSKFTGVAAYRLAQKLPSKPRFVYFVHMDAEQDELVKILGLEKSKRKHIKSDVADSEVKTKSRVELENELTRKADIVISIGPRLYGFAKQVLGDESSKCRQLLCGWKRKGLRGKQPIVVRFLLLGRADNTYVKGQDTFAKAAGVVVKRWKEEKLSGTPKFVVFGAEKGKVAELRKKLSKEAVKESGGYDVTVSVCRYSQVYKEIEEEFKRATAVVMPSRSEGFGLVAAEAASYGVPIVVSSESGLGMHLAKKFQMRNGSRWDSSLSILDTEKTDAHNILAETLLRLARDDDIATLSGARTNGLLQGCSWGNAAQTFLRHLEILPEIACDPLSIDFNLPDRLLEFAKEQAPQGLVLLHEYSIQPTKEAIAACRSRLTQHLRTISSTYEQLKNDLKDRTQFKKLPNKVRKVLKEPLYQISSVILKAPKSALNVIRGHFESYFELSFAYLIEADDSNRLFDSLLSEMIILLRCAFGSYEGAFDAVRPGVESLVWLLQRIGPDNRQKALGFLEALAAEEDDWGPSNAGIKTVMCQLLQAGLYTEVYDFLRMRGSLPKKCELYARLKDVETCVISMLSRKGGTGKSLLSMLVLLSYLKEKPGSKVCIIDMDCSGPTWQYLLFPEEDKPNRFLNELIDARELTRKVFSFSEEQLKSTLHELLQSRSVCDPLGTMSLLTLRDLPRTNRNVREAILYNQQNTARYADFLLEIIKFLNAQDFGMVVIDNAPGFGVIPLTSHSLSSVAPYGQTLIVSTPYLPDIRGVLVDLSDERLLYKGEPPIWIINKIRGDTEAFLRRKKTIYEVASATKAYGSLLPKRPIVSKMQKKFDPPFAQLQFDDDFLSFVTVEDRKEGMTPDKEINQMVEATMISKLMKQFRKRVVPYLVKHFNKEGCSVKNHTKKARKRR